MEEVLTTGSGLSGDTYSPNSSLELMELRREQDNERLIDRIRSDERQKVFAEQEQAAVQDSMIQEGLEMAREQGFMEGVGLSGFNQEEPAPQERQDFATSPGLGNL